MSDTETTEVEQQTRAQIGSTIRSRPGERSMQHLKDSSHRNKTVLKILYRNEEWQQKEIAEFFDVSPTTISNVIHEYGLEKYGPGWRGRFSVEGRSGYPTYYEGSKAVSTHQLVAIADGADPEKVFGSNSYSVHHINGCKMDNRAENLELLGRKEHGRRDAPKASNPYSHSDVLTLVASMLQPGEYLVD